MMNSVLCESPRVRHPQSKCASKCGSRYVSLCLHLFFIIVLDTRFMFLVLGFWSLVLGTLSWSLVRRELQQRPKTKNPFKSCQVHQIRIARLRKCEIAKIATVMVNEFSTCNESLTIKSNSAIPQFRNPAIHSRALRIGSISPPATSFCKRFSSMPATRPRMIRASDA
jgi:hypothetical protein